MGKSVEFDQKKLQLKLIIGNWEKPGKITNNQKSS
jgi:hypothetical protein